MVKTTKMETKMVPMDQFVQKKVKKVVKQLVMKKQLQRTSQVLMLDQSLTEWQTIVPMSPTDVEFASVAIPNTRETTCALQVPQQVKEQIEIEVPTYEEIVLYETVYVKENIMVPLQVAVDVWNPVAEEHCPCRTMNHRH